MPALEAMKESLDKLYFKCEIKETADVTPYFTGDFDCAIIGVGMGDIFSAFGALFMMDSGMDLAMYDDGGELANRIMQANDPESAKQALLDIDATMAYIALSYPARFYAYDDRLDFGDPVYFDFITAKWKK